MKRKVASNAGKSVYCYFSKSDIWKLLSLFLLVFLASANGFWSSIKRERDVIRNSDIGKIAVGLESYKQAFGSYPESSEDGRIVACAGKDTKVLRDRRGSPVREPGASRDKLVNLVPCDWGKDSLRDALDGNYPPFLDKLPQDPLAEKGFSYRYSFKDGKYFIYVAYETKKMPDYSRNVLSQKEKCGTKFCNAARTNGVVMVK